MADPGIQLADIYVEVTEAAAATVYLRPETATETDATVSNPAHAVDGDAATYAELSDATTAVLSLTQFANSRQVSDAGRDWVELRVTGDWANSPDAADTLEVEYRGVSTDAWTSLDTALGGAEWDGSTRVFTITTEAGTNPEADWEVQITYTRNAGAGTFRVYEVEAEVGGDVVAPTSAELAEDVEELAQAKFASWWNALAAAVEAAVATFGSSAAERTSVFNALRDETIAADAYTTLTASASRAQAEAYEDTAEAVGFPRFTGSVEP